ncbi:lincosamide nucleotidyltransferase Lnu(E) [Enterococcus lactis]|nr:lincosamide nucleotidyltransferase Lnu(E) [Enterococcus faecalis]AGT57825.1 lincomycin resistance protein [synthetic construct]EIV0112638.1 lincosamide nucleotidyltransferase Lnu(E) [Enterococcus faecalis]EIV0113441.1 lincosamide nucleotidyltransferase Lnu(E) [Enterococcus faecalis]MCU2267614.1 lincosamide nucleotidyltransferase Lnu(E) [Enterococcus faecalis]
MGKNNVTEKHLFYILDLLKDLQITYWLDGGWGVDVLTGKQQREHRDIDIDFDSQHTDKLVKKLKEIGYITVVDWMPSRMELKHEEYGYLDIHPLDLKKDGTATQADPKGGFYLFEKDWFTTTNYKNRKIPCISKEAQLLFHSGYELTEKDQFDIKNLNSINQVKKEGHFSNDF